MKIHKMVGIGLHALTLVTLKNNKTIEGLKYPKTKKIIE
jgi:hypothetical protein